MPKIRIKRKAARPLPKHSNTTLKPEAESPLFNAVQAMIEQQRQAGKKDSDDFLYVVYVRKSTDTDDKQPITLDDQLAECETLARNKKLKVAHIYRESVSAKNPGNRPVFREMLDNIIRGRYDGIIALAPDRLARNMREGGEIIDLLDQGVIKDLRFCSIDFVNSPEGKMLLGISFVMAKQWVEGHAGRVKMATDRRTREGINLGKPKHGYYNDETGCMRPDGDNWQLIRGVFERRLQGVSLKEIAEWLKAEGYPLKSPSHRRPLIIDEAFISSILKETVYAGILIYGGEYVDLRKQYDFQPIVTEDEFVQVTKIDGFKKDLKMFKQILKHKNTTNLLRGMVVCDMCGSPMTVSIAKKQKSGTQYLYYRCNTIGCLGIKGGKRVHVRAHVVVDAAKKWVKDHPILHEIGHAHYVKEMNRIIVEKKKEMADQLRSLEQKKNAKKQHLEKIKALIIEANDKSVASLYSEDIKTDKEMIKDFDSQIKKLHDDVETTKQGILAFKDFVEQAQKLSEMLDKTNNAAQLDQILRKIFSNFYIKDKKVSRITQNSPWRELCLDANSAMVTPQGIEP